MYTDTQWSMKPSLANVKSARMHASKLRREGTLLARGCRLPNTTEPTFSRGNSSSPYFVYLVHPVTRHFFRFFVEEVVTFAKRGYESSRPPPRNPIKLRSTQGACDGPNGPIGIRHRCVYRTSILKIRPQKPQSLRHPPYDAMFKEPLNVGYLNNSRHVSRPRKGMCATEGQCCAPRQATKTNKKGRAPTSCRVKDRQELMCFVANGGTKEFNFRGGHASVLTAGTPRPWAHGKGIHAQARKKRTKPAST